MPVTGLGLGAFIAALFGRLFVSQVLYFVAMKVLLTTLFLVALPIVLNNVMHAALDTLVTVTTEATGAAGFNSPILSTVTGVTAFFLTALKLPEVVSILFSALSVRAALSFLRLR